MLKVRFVLVSLGCHNKIPQTGGLATEVYFLPVLEAGKAKIKVPPQSVSHESSPSGLQTATCSLRPHMVEEERALWCLFL